MIGKNAHYFYIVYCAGTMQNKLLKGIPMFKALKSIWQGLTQKGKIFPHQLAFTLLIPLRNWALSPQQIVQQLNLAPHHCILEVGCGAGYFSPKLAQSVPQGRLVAASRSLHPHQPRAWLRHTPYLWAMQTLRLRCRVCAVRTHAVFVVTK